MGGPGVIITIIVIASLVALFVWKTRYTVFKTILIVILSFILFLFVLTGIFIWLYDRSEMRRAEERREIQVDSTEHYQQNTISDSIYIKD